MNESTQPRWPSKAEWDAERRWYRAAELMLFRYGTNPNIPAEKWEKIREQTIKEIEEYEREHGSN